MRFLSFLTFKAWGGYSEAATECRAGDFNAQELAITAWVFAAVGQLDALVFTALTRVAERCMGDFNAQDLANTAWAFATVDQLDAALFAALAKEAK